MLVQVDVTNPLWTSLSAYLKRELEDLRTQLESTKPELETARLRGEISRIRKILDLPSAAREPETGTEYGLDLSTY